MLTDIEIESFQSLKKLSLKLGKFTVVTGATGSGKSAVLRAIRLLAFNARGTSYITRGEKSCTVILSDGELLNVLLSRGARGQDKYQLVIPRVSPRDEPHAETFTKLGGSVPGQVQEALRLSELNFAAQFDRPFLLDAPGGEIARVLGRLTNVTLLFDAAREANRRRLEVMGDLKRAEANLAGLTEAAQRFRGMKQRHAAVSEAEEAMARAGQVTARRTRLHALTDRLEAAQGALKAAALPEVLDGTRLAELWGQLVRARELYRQLDEAVTDGAGAEFAADQAALTEQAAHERLHEVLAEAGQCPTCGAAVS